MLNTTNYYVGLQFVRGRNTMPDNNSSPELHTEYVLLVFLSSCDKYCIAAVGLLQQIVNMVQAEEIINVSMATHTFYSRVSTLTNLSDHSERNRTAATSQQTLVTRVAAIDTPILISNRHFTGLAVRQDTQHADRQTDRQQTDSYRQTDRTAHHAVAY